MLKMILSKGYYKTTTLIRNLPNVDVKNYMFIGSSLKIRYFLSEKLTDTYASLDFLTKQGGRLSEFLLCINHSQEEIVFGLLNICFVYGMVVSKVPVWIGHFGSTPYGSICTPWKENPYLMW